MTPNPAMRRTSRIKPRNAGDFERFHKADSKVTRALSTVRGDDARTFAVKIITSLLVAGGLAACEDGKPIVLNTDTHLSPSGTWAAVLEEVDNGMGFGQGALLREVHLLKAGEIADAHGDPSSSVVFYVESTYGKGKDVSVEWLSERSVRIRYDSVQRPGKQVRSYRGVNVDIGPYPSSTQ